MPKINVNNEQWSDVVLVYLLDTIRKEKVLDSTSDDFKDFMKKARQVIRPLLVKHFLVMDPEIRVKYRLIRSAFSRGDRATVDIVNKKGEKLIQ